jgi:hypothetical protein
MRFDSDWAAGGDAVGDVDSDAEGGFFVGGDLLEEAHAMRGFCIEAIAHAFCASTSFVSLATPSSDTGFAQQWHGLCSLPSDDI